MTAAFERKMPKLTTCIHALLVFTMCIGIGCSMAVGLMQIGPELEKVMGVSITLIVVIFFIGIWKLLKKIYGKPKFVAKENEWEELIKASTIKTPIKRVCHKYLLRVHLCAPN